MANMSHGLWGPIDDNFEQPGFFDSDRAYYPVTLNDDNNTISYTGDMQGGNYQPIFGNWLPSVWEPTGIFHDDDANPETDGVIKAFLGVAPGFEKRAWYKSTVDITDPKNPKYVWSEATDADFAEWTGDLYEEGPIEDVLNLGLNYIINIGENAAIGSKFTLRITPHVDTNQTPPSSYLPSPGDVAGTGVFNNANFTPDVLWKDADTGDVTVWNMNADGTYTETIIGTLEAGLDIAATGHFDENGIEDILLRNTATQEVSIWYMNGDGTFTNTPIFNTSRQWSIEGTGNFDNAGVTDILMRNKATNEVGIAYMNAEGGFTFDVIFNTSRLWSIEGTNDFNADRVTDILMRNNATNEIGIAYMNADGSFTFTVIFNTSRLWSIEGTGYFNADGVADILMRNSATNEIGIAHMDAEGGFTFDVVFNTSRDWSIEGTSDFDENMVTDILWKNTSTKDIAIAHMNADGTYTFDTIATISE